METHATGRLYTDSLATELALHLLERHSSASNLKHDKASLSGRKLRLVLGYIEDNLAQDLSLRTTRIPSPISGSLNSRKRFANREACRCINT